MSEDKKSDFMEALLESFSRNFNTPRSLAFQEKRCVMCGGEAKEFKNEASRKEYKISGMCQVCQDSFFE